MAKPEIVRSLNYELIEGASDGTYKKIPPNTANPQVNPETAVARSHLNNGLGGYDVIESGERAMHGLHGVVRGT